MKVGGAEPIRKQGPRRPWTLSGLPRQRPFRLRMNAIALNAARVEGQIGMRMSCDSAHAGPCRGLMPCARCQSSGQPSGIGPLAIRLRPRKIRGNRLCTLLHFRALSCNGRLPELLKISYLHLSHGTHNAGVEGSSPSRSTMHLNKINRLRADAYCLPANHWQILGTSGEKGVHRVASVKRVASGKAEFNRCWSGDDLRCFLPCRFRPGFADTQCDAKSFLTT